MYKSKKKRKEKENAKNRVLNPDSLYKKGRWKTPQSFQNKKQQKKTTMHKVTRLVVHITI
jgi:hypothetical protein